MEGMDTNTAYQTLVTHLENNFYIKSSLDLLQWDAQVNLPPSSGEMRAAQTAALSEVLHNKSIDPAIGRLLDQLESSQDKLTYQELTVVRETRKDYQRAVKLPAEFVAKKTESQCLSFLAWTEARKNSDFAAFAPYLQRELDLAIQEAEYVGSHANPYDYAIDKHDPGLNSEFIEKRFTELKKALIPIIKEITSSSIKPDSSILKGFPIAKQEQFVREVTEKLGFDYSHGRMDRSVHPFCSGNSQDLRMTTRYNENVPLDSLFSSIHETGHGLYEQGLPKEYIGTPLARAIGMAVHESQSRLWENQVGRSKSFWKYWEPRYRELFKDQLSQIDSDLLYLTINSVERNPIRVDSDEVTYNLHIILRFELEKQLFNKILLVKDLPEIWNATSMEIIGITPKNNKEGVLQDVHWSIGAFGYFPSYCLGNMMAAQLWYAANKQLIALKDHIAEGNFCQLLTWLRTNIHQYGQQYTIHETLERVTGEPLSSKYLIQYLSERYLPLYSKA